MPPDDDGTSGPSDPRQQPGDPGGSDDPGGSRPGDPDAAVMPRWWDPDQQELLLRRKAVQVRAIIRGFAEVGIPVAYGFSGEQDPGPAGMEYLYRTDQLLTRDRDVERVSAVLGRDVSQSKERRGAASSASGTSATRVVRPGRSTAPADGRRPSEVYRDQSLSGLFPVQLFDDEDATRVIEACDAQLGRGVVTFDHVVHVTPAGGCPATEPVPSDGPPDPPSNEARASDGTGVRVVVVDTGLVPGVVEDHDWLKGVTGDVEDPAVGHYRGHGGFIAGVIRSMAPQAEVHVEPFLYAAGAILESDLAPALARALESTPDIISMSAGTTTRDGEPLLSLRVFWEERLSQLKGTVLVCAAGNDGDRGPFYPAAFPWTVSVGALEADGTRAGYSNFGSWVDVYARGSDVVNAYPRGEYTYQEPPLDDPPTTVDFTSGLASWSGTSFATPMVAGLIAARMSATGETARQAADTLLDLAHTNARPRIGSVLDPSVLA